MSSVANWLAIGGAFAGFGAMLYAVRRYVLVQARKIAAILDPCDYVVIEAAPEQIAEVRSDFEKNGWRSESSKPTSGRGILTTFIRTSQQATPLSELLGVGGKTPLASAKKSASDFQMKIKAHGPLSDLRA